MTKPKYNNNNYESNITNYAVLTSCINIKY